ncbi:MAG: MinD/ParA family protein [Deltaproteobacteria bacterium]|nr:MinD/ParA family protein [Deltaproteobacteria bacterium]
MNDASNENSPPARGGDQAQVRVISVTSGKGGVGKTNAVVNMAIAFARAGKRCLVLDADLGLGNIDVLLGLAPQYNVGHVLRGEKAMSDVVVDGPAGIKILPASSGVCELTDLGAGERLAVISHLESYAASEGAFDLMLIDTAAGISGNVLFFNAASREIIIVVTPEPTAITDAYALMKVLLGRHGERSFKLIVNCAKTKKHGLAVYRNICGAADRFLNVSIDYLGCVLQDECVPKAVARQKAVMELFPDSRASACFREVAAAALEHAPPTGIKGGMQLFWRNVVNKGY